MPSSTPDIDPAFQVRLDGRDYMVDISQYRRQVLPRQRNTIFQTGENSELIFNDEGFWIRSQHSWQWGEGQAVLDDDEEPDNGDRRRYRYGFRAQPGDEEVGIGPELQFVDGSDNAARARYLTDGTKLYAWLASGGTYYRANDAAAPSITWSSFTDTGTQTRDMIWANNYLYAATQNGLRRNDFSTATSLNATRSGLRLWYENDRLLMAATDRGLYEYRDPGSTPWTETLVHTLEEGWEWKSVVGTPVGIFAAAASERETIIYYLAVDTATGDLESGVVAGLLPYGEVLEKMYHYGGVILLGTSIGIRVATYGVNPLSNGVLEINQAVQLFDCHCDGNAVRAFIGLGPYVYFGWEDFSYPTTDTVASSTVYQGIGRLDLTRSTLPDQLVPSYSLVAATSDWGTNPTIQDLLLLEVSDYNAAGTYLTTSSLHLFFYAHNKGWLFNGREWRASRRRAPSAVVTGSWVNNSTLVPKVLSSLEVYTHPLPADTHIEAFIRYRDGEVFNVGVMTTPDQEYATFDLTNLPPAIEVSVELLLETADTALGYGPEVRGWSLHMLPIPQRQSEIILPVILHSRIVNAVGATRVQSPLAEFSHLEELCRTGQFVDYTESGADPIKVRVDRVLMLDESARSIDGQDWIEHIAMVRLLTAEQGGEY